MKIIIKDGVAREIGYGAFAPFNIDKGSFRYRSDSVELDLEDFSRERTEDLRDLLADSGARGTGVLVKDIARWLKTIDGDDSVKPRSVSQFNDLFTKQLAEKPGHRLYRRLDDGTVLVYYTSSIRYTPPQRTRDDYRPADSTMKLYYREFGEVDETRVAFYEADCRGMTIPEALIRKGYEMETPELRETYLAERRRFAEVQPTIGTQYLATGLATDDCDGNHDSDRGWFSSRSNTLRLDPNGVPSKCILDLFFENERSDKCRAHYVESWFWDNKAKKIDERDDFGEDVDSRSSIEIPLHPYLAVFHLAKHLRLRCHVANLTEYQYDTKIADKLVVPEDLRSLIKMLIEHKDGGHKDIIEGKSGGAVVLLSGPPGVGKTLTAEVYAEAESRPLYSIQCSQLGIDPAALEDELLKTFTRAMRWDAILLLDEADVYIRTRGEDLIQNSIVGVFLRVLEYQSAVMFMTTNRPESVDDAIASRCIARITYAMPTPDEQRRIWIILAGLAGAEITEETIAEITAKGDLSGRDIKNLLKLSLLMEPNTAIKAATVDFVKKFRPSSTI